jgi:CYTH domain-containing protein
MKSEEDTPPLPGWLGREVTGNKRYSNRVLAMRSNGLSAVGLIRLDAQAYSHA